MSLATAAAAVPAATTSRASEPSRPVTRADVQSASTGASERGTELPLAAAPAGSLPKAVADSLPKAGAGAPSPAAQATVPPPSSATSKDAPAPAPGTSAGAPPDRPPPQAGGDRGAAGEATAPPAGHSDPPRQAGQGTAAPRAAVQRPIARQGISTTSAVTAPAASTATQSAAAPSTAVGGSATVPAPAPAPTAAASAPSTGVDMNGMIESIHGRIELAARQGESQARISLEPAELGEIRIHLTQTSSGLLARLTADTPAAAQALAAGRGELHEALSSLGTTLLRLDIGFSGPSEGRQGRQDDGPARSSRRSESAEDEQNVETTIGPEASQAAGPQALGELVDVLA